MRVEATDRSDASTECLACDEPRKLIKTELGAIGFDIEVRQCPSCQSTIRFAKRWPKWPWKIKPKGRTKAPRRPKRRAG
jgi:hypothetical protein